MPWTACRRKYLPLICFMGGVVCKSMSTQNNQRHAHGACILSGTGKTGSTFEGLRRYVQKVRPNIVICENVVGLVKRTRGGHPQIVGVGEACERLGYHFAYRHVDARRYLLPHRRTRVWMWAVREDISAAPAASRVNALLEQLEQPEPAPLDPFLEVAAGGERPRQELNAREGKVLITVINKLA